MPDSKILLGDCLIKMREMENNSVDSIVTDPPYGISFMGKKWDYDVPSVEIWKECLRVLKPGGHLLSVCGTRTYHRMAVNIEDAGFEIRDVISWIYGSGFPKSLNIGKAIDKLEGNEREVVGYDEIARAKTKAERSRGVSNHHNFNEAHDKGRGGFVNPDEVGKITKGNSPWEGWGTALKPACEFWALCRKPLSEKTVAKNVLKHGTGGINVDGCRVGTEEIQIRRHKGYNSNSLVESTKGKWTGKTEKVQGRFPSNLIHDGSEESTEGLGDSTRYFYCAKASKKDRNEGLEGMKEKSSKKMEGGKFEFASTTATDRIAKNNHPTVKPTPLMQYLVRLVTPPHGTVLDTFMGSGGTGKACMLEGFKFIGIELDKDYCEIAKKRIESVPLPML